jgi:hypothetical protein
VKIVGLDLHRQLVEVGPLADPRRVDSVGGAPDRREDRVDRDHPNRLVLGLVLLRGRITTASTDGQIHLQLGSLLERGDGDVGVEDLDSGGQVNVLRLDLAGAGGDQRSLDLVRIGVHADHDVLEVEDDVRDILLHAGDVGELVRDALDPNALDRGATQ